jgi:phosphoglycolate phosphatase
MRYELVIFDWDGTLMDSTGLIAECIRLAAQDCGLPQPSIDQGKSIIGLGLVDSIERLFPGLSEEKRHEFVARYRHHYVPRDHEVSVFPGVEELLVSLAKPERFLCVATGKPRAGLERAFRHSGLKAYFHYSRCGDEGFAKPHPDMLIKLMEFTGVDASRTLMIGDTSHDLELAANAGVDGVGVSYGAHPKAHLESYKAKTIVSSVNELSTWLMQNA